MEQKFFGVHISEGENMTITYRTGLTTYTEGLRDGIFTALGWNGAGYLLSPIIHGLTLLFLTLRIMLSRAHLNLTLTANP